ncbi:MAG: glycosyltransferase, partial [Candidatus Deferrimicrobiaceae bacterium]
MTAVVRGPVRIAYVLPYLVAGGTEGHVLSLVRRIDRHGFPPLVIALGGGGELEPAFRKEGVPVHILDRTGITPRPGQRGRTMRDALGCAWSLSGILRRERPEILHTYLPIANVIGPIAARLSRVRRVIVSKRALANYKERFPLLRRIEPLGNRLADVILVNSDAVRRDVERTERNWEGKSRKIYNGVAPVPPWTPEERKAFRQR